MISLDSFSQTIKNQYMDEHLLPVLYIDAIS